MPNELQRQIEAIASRFAAEITQAIRDAKVDDLVTLGAPRTVTIQEWVASVEADLGTRGKPGRPKKTAKHDPTARDIPSGREAVLSFLRGQPGSSGEAVRKANKMPREQWSRTISSLLATKGVRKEGAKRGTRYWVA